MFEDFFKFLENKKVLITTHDLVDLDGFVSCIAFKFFLNQYFKTTQAYILFPELSKSTKEFLDKYLTKYPDFEINLEVDTNLSEIQLICILDTNNIDLLHFENNFDLIKSEIPYIFIDHHQKLKKKDIGNVESLNLIFDETSSTAEIILEFFNTCNIIPPPALKFLLISGILTDSGFFKYGDNNTIIHVSYLLDKTFDFQDVRMLLKRDNDDISIKLANIKGLQRVKIIREKDWLIGITHVGSYESSVASMLLRIGFDIGIVYSDKKTEFRITTRAKKEVCLLAGLHLGEILENLSEDFQGNGGGHDGAGSLTLEIKNEEVLNTLVAKIKQVLNE